MENEIFQEMMKGLTKKQSGIYDYIKKYIEQNSSENDDLLLIGDSRTDYEAAILNNISFVLRRTENNVFMHEMKGIHVINDFTNIKGISI